MYGRGLLRPVGQTKACPYGKHGQTKACPYAVRFFVGATPCGRPVHKGQAHRPAPTPKGRLRKAGSFQSKSPGREAYGAELREPMKAHQGAVTYGQTFATYPFRRCGSWTGFSCCVYVCTVPLGQVRTTVPIVALHPPWA